MEECHVLRPDLHVTKTEGAKQENTSLQKIVVQQRKLGGNEADHSGPSGGQMVAAQVQVPHLHVTSVLAERATTAMEDNHKEPAV